MRAFVIMGLLLGLTVGAWADGLSPGRPAGIRQAQFHPTPLYIGLLVSGLVVCGFIVASRNGGTATPATSP
jgi:hypothetical protein